MQNLLRQNPSPLDTVQFTVTLVEEKKTFSGFSKPFSGIVSKIHQETLSFSRKTHFPQLILCNLQVWRPLGWMTSFNPLWADFNEMRQSQINKSSFKVLACEPAFTKKADILLLLPLSWSFCKRLFCLLRWVAQVSSPWRLFYANV